MDSLQTRKDEKVNDDKTMKNGVMSGEEIWKNRKKKASLKDVK